MPYGKGAIVIIRYDYQDGIHVASKVSHFRDIAKIIETMHDSDFVHGDVRGFNMLHPHSEESLNGLKRSCLIDFDLARMNEKDKYSLGFSQTSPEILGDRIGKLGKCMKFQHDWVELGATMDEYQVKANDTGNSSQEGQKFQDFIAEIENVPENPVECFNDFIVENGDLSLELPRSAAKIYNEMEKGTNSPNNDKQVARGLLSSLERQIEK
jgi:hypothetical protein